MGRVSQQLTDIRPESGKIARAIDTWQKHEVYMEAREVAPEIVKKFVSVGKDLNLKALIQRAM